MPAGSVYLDKDGHEIEDQAGVTQLTAGAVSTTAVGTISPTTAAGATPTVAISDCTDRRGNFTLSPVTGGGAQAAGTVAKVRFVKPYTDAPGSVLVNVTNETDATTVAAGVTLLTADGFDIETTVLTTAKVYRVTYFVVP